MQIAELNSAHPKYPLDDPRIAPFINALDAINALAERSPGFVWRLRGEGNNATDLTLADAPDAIVNVSVWDSVEALEHFVFNTVHHRFYRRRDAWFDSARKAHFVMWRVADGHRPTLAEAERMLRRLREEGASDEVFAWADIPAITRWREARCTAPARSAAGR